MTEDEYNIRWRKELQVCKDTIVDKINCSNDKNSTCHVDIKKKIVEIDVKNKLENKDLKNSINNIEKSIEPIKKISWTILIIILSGFITGVLNLILK